MESYVTPVSDLASLGDRLGGQIVDALISFVIAAVLIVPALMIGDAAVIAVPIAVVLAYGYLLFADGLEGGQSYGKRLLGIAVIDSVTGRACSFGQSFVRNILLSILGPLDWIFIFGRKRQRLGDKAAGTLVINAVGKVTLWGGAP